MDYQIRKAGRQDLRRIEEIYAYARAFMAANGNPNQWGQTHPPVEQLEQDMQNGDLYTIVDGKEIHGVFYFCIGEDPTYAKIHDGAWHSDQSYGTIHRIAGDGSGGILHTAVTFAGKQIDYLRMDTYKDNKVMQRALEKQGFRRCGTIYVEEDFPMIAYDRLGKELE